MRKTVLALAIVTVTSGAAFAQYTGPSDTAPSKAAGYPSTTIAAILADPKDDAKVTLEGHLLRKVGDETYVFSDGTGEIQVEIDDEDFPNQSVSESTKVRIEGEVDTHLIKDTDIDADRVTVIE